MNIDMHVVLLEIGGSVSNKTKSERLMAAAAVNATNTSTGLSCGAGFRLQDLHPTRRGLCCCGRFFLSGRREASVLVHCDTLHSSVGSAYDRADVM